METYDVIVNQPVVIDNVSKEREERREKCFNFLYGRVVPSFDTYTLTQHSTHTHTVYVADDITDGTTFARK